LQFKPDTDVALLNAMMHTILTEGLQDEEFIREHTEDFGGSPLATLMGGGRTAPDRAAFLNGAAVRYLDFNERLPRSR